jgi:hypothetical protein
MAIRYTDSSISAAQSTANTGLSPLSPKRLPSDHTISSGDEVWLKGGGPDYIMPAAAIPCQWSSILNGAVRRWPGTPKPVVRHPDPGDLGTQGRVFALGSGGNWTVEGIVFNGCAAACANMNTGSGTGILTLLNNEVYNCSMTYYASASGYMTAFAAGGTSALAEVYAIGNVIDGTGSDQMWFRATNKAEVAYNTLLNPSLLDALGDNIQFFESCTDLWVHHNYIDHKNVDSKQAFIQSLGFSGTTRFEDNMVRGFVGSGSSELHTAVYSDQKLLCRRNYIESATSSIYYGTNGTVIEANVIRGGNGRTNTGHIWGATITDLRIEHNLLIKAFGSADTGEAAIRSTTSSASIITRNNIIDGFQRGIRRGASSVESNNLFWNVATPVIDSAGSTPLSAVNPVLLNPMYRDRDRPWIGLSPGSPVRGAGTYIQGARDRFGRKYGVRPNIGPWAVLPSR